MNTSGGKLPLESLIRGLKRILPHALIAKILPYYHWLWSFGSALFYRFPARKIDVIFITGSKGKTTTAELVNALLEGAGLQTALASTLRFKIGKHQIPNQFKMSVPGRGLLQQFLRSAVDSGCEIAIMEMTSQAVLDHRHRFLFPNALIFTNIEAEHIEAHGSYENYLEAKLQLAEQLKKSFKTEKTIIANLDDKEGRKFIARAFCGELKDSSFSIADDLTKVKVKGNLKFTYKDLDFTSPLQGRHNLKNILAAIKVARFFGAPLTSIQETLKDFSVVRGRLERIQEATDQGLEVYVDYAHTPESLRAVYNTFPEQNIIGVLGNTGGGRDTWKREVMASIAEEHCAKIILTDEDPYDEDPRSIVETMYQAIQNKDKVEIEMDRRTAISKALKIAQKGEVVLITGKGTDPYIMRANGEREAWDDATVVREELAKIKI